MKVLIIILVIVFVSFFGVLVYSTHRDEQPKRACEQMPPSFKTKKGPSDDDVKDWCPPDLAKSFTKKTRGLQRRFVKGLGLKPPVELQSTPQANVSLPVQVLDKETKAAKVTLISGDWAVLGNGKDRLCLCSPGSKLPGPFFTAQCGDEWIADHSATGGLCQRYDDGGLLAFRKPGGLLEVLAGPPATVKIE